ncbi:uroporphyrinogen decarboxylase family protein [Desulfosporosinus sp. FKA]|uniref:uroporphyrinogen decarboxylase family protein n=1 Tax=Desulfosporosinus sp. FKA TaxID=1969834 RepID=UPI000B4A5231|nr:uroporphyrinogen decarboxylase family protein [Desulfosporosinus sp. FKA]
MTKVERILAAINFAKVDRVPKGEFNLDDNFVAKLLGLKNHVRFEDRVEACERCGLDAVAFGLGNEPGNQTGLWHELKRWREETDFFIFALIDGPFQGTAKLFSSFTNYLLAIAQGDPIIPELVQQVAATNLELGLNALALGAHGLIIADDIAYNGGTFVSPAALRLNFFPSIREQVKELQHEEVPVFFHADGDLRKVLNDIINSGINGLHSLDFQSLEEISEVRKATEDRVCLMGGYDLGWFEEEKRIERAYNLLEVTAKGGGYIFGSSAGILGSGQTPQNVLEVYRYVKNY